jgi:hypothetical protein
VGFQNYRARASTTTAEQKGFYKLIVFNVRFYSIKGPYLGLFIEKLA